MIKKPLLYAGIVFSIYFLIILLLPKNTFWITDTGNRFLILQNIIEKKNKDFSINYPGDAIDSDLKYSPFLTDHYNKKQGHFFSVYPVQFPWLSGFLYRWFSYPGLYLIPSVCSFFILIISVKIYALLYDNTNKWFVIPVLGLCSPLLFYSVVFWEQSLSALLSTGAIFILLNFISSPMPKNRFLIAAGIIASLTVWFRPDGYLFFIALIIGLFSLYGLHKNIFIFLCTFIVSLLPLWVFNHQVFGYFLGNRFINLIELELIKPLSNTHLLKTDSIFSLFGKKIYVLFHMLFEGHRKDKYSLIMGIPFICFPFFSFFKNKHHSIKHLMLILGIVAILLSEILAILLNLRNEYPVFNTFYTQGLFLSVPYAVFAFYAIAELKNTCKREFVFTSVVIITYIFLFALINPNKKGIIWGPRFLLSIIPVLVVLSLGKWQELTAAFTDNFKNFFFDLMVVLLIFLSFLYQGYGIKLLYDKKQGIAYMLKIVKTQSYKHVITDVFWISEEMSAIFYDKVIFYIKEDNDVIDLIKRLRKNNIKKFSIIISPIYSHVIKYNTLFGDKLYAVNGLMNFKLIEESRIPILYNGVKSHETAVINYSIIDLKK